MRHRFELGCDLELRSMTWLMPIEATNPQPNANANNNSDFGRMISLGSVCGEWADFPSLPVQVGADWNSRATLAFASVTANGTLSVSSARSTNPDSSKSSCRQGRRSLRTGGQRVVAEFRVRISCAVQA